MRILVQSCGTRTVADRRWENDGGATWHCALRVGYFGCGWSCRCCGSGYRKGAEQGYAWSQFGLGGAYFSGEGVPQDYAEAVKWFRAAEQDHAEAASMQEFSCSP